MTKFVVLLLAGLALAALQPALAVDPEKFEQMTAIVESLFCDVRAALEQRFILEDITIGAVNSTLTSAASAETPVENKVTAVLKISDKVAEDVKSPTRLQRTWRSTVVRGKDVVLKTKDVAKAGAEVIQQWSCKAIGSMKHYALPAGSFVVNKGRAAGEAMGKLFKTKCGVLLKSASTIEVPPDSALVYDD